MDTKQDGETASAVRKTLSEAMSLQAQGDLLQAEEKYIEVLASDYRPADILPLLAGIVSKRGDMERALMYWERLLAIKPKQLIALIERGTLLHRTGRLAECVESLTVARSIDPDHPVVLTNLAVALADSGRRDEALAVFQKAIALQPDNIHLHHQSRRISSAIVPFWHIPMMNDVRRNDAFEAAIIAAVALRGPDARILDIGSGSGLLSLMAARAGATHVTTCEIVPVIAEMAEKIVRRSGYGNHIRVIKKASNEIKLGDDMSARADILISEILSSDLLAENVIDTFEDAHARLLNDDATVIPRAATARGCLVESETLSKYAFVDRVSGFDVSDFNQLAPQRLPLHGTMTAWKRLSSDFDMVSIDLTKKRHETDIRRLSIPVTADGVAAGVVQWMHLDLAEGITFANHPDDYVDGGWLQVLHTFPQPIKVTAGTALSLAVGHDRTSLIVTPLS